jgi:hypothetical protein
VIRAKGRFVSNLLAHQVERLVRIGLDGELQRSGSAAPTCEARPS